MSSFSFHTRDANAQFCPYNEEEARALATAILVSKHEYAWRKEHPEAPHEAPKISPLALERAVNLQLREMEGQLMRQGTDLEWIQTRVL